MRRWRACAAAGALSWLAAALAAAPARAEDFVAKADALFAEGVALRESNFDAACAKFSASHALNPQAIGALLNVALCDERQGRVASAVRRYREARQRSIEQGFHQHQIVTEQKLAALEPDVPYLGIELRPPIAPQTKVVIDERVIASEELARIALDPGDHVLIVSAPGRIPYERRLQIAPRRFLRLDVPPLARPVASLRRPVGKVILASGAAALASGVVIGAIARSRYPAVSDLPDSPMDNAIFSDGVPNCWRVAGGPTECDDRGHDAARSARTLGDVGTIAGSVGVAAIVVGGYLWYSSRSSGKSAERRVSWAPYIGPGGPGVVVSGALP